MPPPGIYHQAGCACCAEFTYTPTPGAYFGTSVDVDGDYCIVGAPADDTAYVGKRSGYTWPQEDELVPTGGGFSYYGASVAINDDTAAVGDPQYGGSVFNGGAVIVFTRSGTVWNQQQLIEATTPSSSALVGCSCDLDGDTLIAGAQGDWSDTPPTFKGGAAYVFTRSGATWTEQQKLVASDAAASDAFGYWVGLDSDTAIVGAPNETAGGAYAGAAYVFTRSGATWTEQQKLVASDAAANDAFGRCVSVSGDRAIVGAPDKGTGGAAYVFTRSGSTWTQQQKITSPNAEANGHFAAAVRIDGDMLVIGAPLETVKGYSSQGRTYRYKLVDITWSLQATKVPQCLSETQDGPQLGASVSMQNTAAIFGMPQWDNNAGNTEEGQAMVCRFER